MASTRSPISSMARRGRAAPSLSFAQPAPPGASATRATARRSPRPPRSMRRASAATIRSRSGAAPRPPGNPSLWLIAEKRLYLFYSAEARAAFARDTGTAIEAAERNWPAVQRTPGPRLAGLRAAARDEALTREIRAGHIEARCRPAGASGRRPRPARRGPPRCPIPRSVRAGDRDRLRLPPPGRTSATSRTRSALARDRRSR